MAIRAVTTGDLFPISVIVPVYNGERYLERCIQSIFHQNEQKLELILVNDGSKDKSEEIIQKMKKAAPESIRFYSVLQENTGAAEARNTGIRMAVGEYITFVDQDDFITEGTFSAYLEAIRKSRADIIVGGYQRVSEEKMIREVKLRNTRWAPFLVTAPWAHFYRRDFVLSNDIRFLPSPLCEDVYFNLMAYSRANKIFCIGDTGYRWFYNEESVSNSRQKTISKTNDPLYFLNMTINGFPQENQVPPELLEYFFIRYVTWFELFTVRGSSKNDVLEMDTELKKWLQEHYPNYLRNRYIRTMPEGEIRSVHFSVYIMALLEKLHLNRKFLSLLAS